jgi:hypothetical protein
VDGGNQKNSLATAVKPWKRNIPVCEGEPSRWGLVDERRSIVLHTDVNLGIDIANPGELSKSVIGVAKS